MALLLHCSKKREEDKMRAELKVLEQMVEKAAENVKGNGNVARTMITLKEVVLIKKGFKSRFSWGRGKIGVEAAEDSRIVGFSFDNAIVDNPLRFKSSGEVFKHNFVPLTALSSETLKELTEKAEGWKEIC